ncbi:MAG: hypothetical protein ACP5JG_02785 [Anaerolineae bacterium]
MEHQATLPSSLIQWADMLRERELVGLGLLILGTLDVWGFVGGQVLWMLAPILGEASLAPLARTLEDPEALEKLRAYLVEGDI